MEYVFLIRGGFTVKNQIMAWLAEHSPLRMYTNNVGGFMNTLSIHDDQLALMFKLTWGDQVDEMSSTFLAKNPL